jgi:hypothetical protein
MKKTTITLLLLLTCVVMTAQAQTVLAPTGQKISIDLSKKAYLAGGKIPQSQLQSITIHYLYKCDK